MAVLPFGVGPMELIIVLVIVLLLFGPKRLPQLGKSLGKTMKAIREGVDGDRCLACHKELRASVAAGRGLHAKLPTGKSCTSCHEEHRQNQSYYLSHYSHR